jgi:FkbM family methyltransferase
MSTMTLPSPSLFERWNRFQSRLHFKYLLPRVRTAHFAGIKLDISSLSPLMKNIILTGRYEAQERKLAAMALRRDDVVLELGGAIGFIGLYCRKVLGVKHVTSVEANPATLRLLQRNYQLNGLTPHVIHAAAAGEDGELDLNVGGEFWENTLTSSSADTVRVPALSLASLVRQMPHSPTVLICDIEGAEQYLDFRQLPPSVTRIIIELHPAMIGQNRVDAILAGLHHQGYEIRCTEDGTSLLETPR